MALPPLLCFLTSRQGCGKTTPSSSCRRAAADLRLILALLAVRDGRFDDTLEWYLELRR
jgi:hypothetical protein